MDKKSLEVLFSGLFLNPPLNKNSRCLLLPEMQSLSSDKSLISLHFYNSVLPLLAPRSALIPKRSTERSHDDSNASGNKGEAAQPM